MDVVFVTALGLELQAVRAHLAETYEKVHPRGTVYSCGVLRLGAHSLSAAIVQTGPGNAGAALEVERAIAYFSARWVVFVGVAGGIKDVSIGDVVAATRIYGYESGKVQDQLLPRPSVGESSYAMVQRARAEANKDDWRARLPAAYSTTTPSAFVGPIAAGEKVVASSRSELSQFIRSTYGDALAIEMEGRGFLQAAQANPQVEAIVIRGISDLLDSKGESDAAGSQEFAAASAAAFAVEMLTKIRESMPAMAAPSTPANATKWSLHIDAAPEDFDEEKIRRIVTQLQELSGDGTLTFHSLHEGSVVLVFESTSDGLNRIAEVEIPELSELLQHRVLNIESSQAVPPEQFQNLQWSVPYPRNPNFVGRSVVMADLRQRLTTPGEAVVLHGLGGVGKTQVALEYAFRYASEYAAVWWIHADHTGTLAQDLIDLGVEVGANMPGQAGGPISVEDTLRWLNANDGWLLIFDDAADFESIASFVPTAGTGDVLITSRSPEWSGVAETVELTVLSDEEVLEFLAARTGNSNVEQLAALARELGNLPLALEQAVSYMETAGASVESYLSLLKDVPSRVLALPGKLPSYPSSVFSTWQISFEHVAQASRLAPELLRLCSFLDADGVPKRLLLPSLWGGHQSQEESEELGVDLALQASRRYSLIAFSSKGIVTHRLVQAVTRASMSLEERTTWASRVVDLIDKSFPVKADQPDNWWECSQLLPHAYAALAHIEGLQVASIPAGRLFNRVSVYLCTQGQYRAAAAILEAGIEYAQSWPEPNRPLLAASEDNLGSAMRGLGDFAGAAAHFGRALDLLGSDASVEVARTLNNLGSVLQDIGRYADALSNYERALQLLANFHDARSDAQKVLNNIGSARHSLGDLQGARTMHEQALAEAEQIYGPVHPEVSVALNNLGTVLHELGDLDAATAALSRAVAITEEINGPQHPDLGIRLANLAAVLKDQGLLEEAQRLYERALEISEKAYGADHPEVGQHLNNLGLLLAERGELEEARVLYERALHIAEASYGSGHPNVATILNNLGGIAHELDDFDSARALYLRALALQRAAFGSEDVRVARTLSNLGGVLLDVKDAVPAEADFREALRIAEKRLGPGSPFVAMCLNNLGAALKELMRFDEAREVLLRAIEIHERTVGGRSPELARDYNNLGGVLRAMGFQREARDAFVRALEINTAALGPNHLDVAISHSNLGMVLLDSGEVEEAEKEHEIAADIFYRRLGEDHPSTKLQKSKLEAVRNRRLNP